MEKVAPEIAYRRLKYVSAWRLVEENQHAARAAIVHGISRADAAGHWGDGTTGWPAMGSASPMPHKVLRRTYSTRFSDFAPGAPPRTAAAWARSFDGSAGRQRGARGVRSPLGGGSARRRGGAEARRGGHRPARALVGARPLVVVEFGEVRDEGGVPRAAGPERSRACRRPSVAGRRAVAGQDPGAVDLPRPTGTVRPQASPRQDDLANWTRGDRKAPLSSRRPSGTLG